MPGTVRLKNGGWVDGDVLEVQPGQNVSVRLSDGTVRQIPWAEVERVDEHPPAPPPAPAPASAPDQSAAPAPAAPATRSAPLSLDDPNVVDVAFAVEERKVYLIGMPRTNATAVAIRFERFVRDAPPVCDAVTITIDGTASRLPAQHKVVSDRFATRELIQVMIDLETVKRMDAATDVSFDLCGVTRRFTPMHTAPIKRFVVAFEHDIGKAVIVQAPPRAQTYDDSEEASSRRAPRRSSGEDEAPLASGYQEHTGLMLRMTTGLGYALTTETLEVSESLSTNDVSLTVSGVAVPFSIDLGGAVSPNLNLHGRLSFFTLPSPALELQGQDLPVAEDASLTAFMLGGGVTYYFMPANAYLTGAFGLGFTHAASANNKAATSDPGFALNFDYRQGMVDR